MKTRHLFTTSVIVLPLFILLTSGTLETLDSSGKLASSGAPGENTCSQSGCHGAGNGSSSSGGLADNMGPGSITLSSTPAFTANHYVPGAVYHMTLTVSEAGKNLFGFDFEALDNSGNTNPQVNNAVGTITITDAVHTRTGQPFGTGRLTCTHKPSGGAFPNAASFTFDWTAPASGTVNMYYDGIASNADGLSNAADNVYANHIQVTPAAATGITGEQAQILSLELYPNPASGEFTFSSGAKIDGPVKVQVYSMDGKLVKAFDAEYADHSVFRHTYSISDLSGGLYLLKAQLSEGSGTYKLVVN